MLHLSYKELCLDRDRLEKVEAIRRRRAEHTRDLGVPVHLLDIRRTVVAEKQLARHRLAIRSLGQLRGIFFVVALDAQVPQRDLVVAARGGKDAVFLGMPLYAADRRAMPVKVRHGTRGLVRLERPHIPYVQGAVIAAGEEQELRAAVPANDIHVLLVRGVDRKSGSVRLDPHVPNADTAVRRARRKDRRLRRTPLQVFDGGRVALERRGVRRKARIVTSGKEDLAVHVTGQEAQVARMTRRSTAQQAAPVHRESFRAVCVHSEERRLDLLLVDRRARHVESIEERAHVPNVHLACLGPRRDGVCIQARLQVRRGRRRRGSAHAVDAA